MKNFTRFRPGKETDNKFKSARAKAAAKVKKDTATSNVSIKTNMKDQQVDTNIAEGLYDSTMCCKDCGDEMGKPTKLNAQCMYDGKDPQGENWIKKESYHEATIPDGQTAFTKKPKVSKGDMDKVGKIQAMMAKEREAQAKKKMMKREEVKHSDMHVKQAIGIATDPRYKGGNMTGAVKTMNKLSKDIHKHPKVAAVLKRVNEISQKTKDSYVSRASGQAQVGAVASKHLKGAEKAKNDKMVQKRQAGIKMATLDEASKEGTIKIIKTKDNRFQVQRMTKGKFVNQGKPYKSAKDAEKMRSSGQHSMQFSHVEEASLNELTAAEKKLINQMYDKKGNLTPMGKKVMDHGKANRNLTPQNRAADNARRKEYNAYQKSKRNEEVELGESALKMKLIDKMKKASPAAKKALEAPSRVDKKVNELTIADVIKATELAKKRQAKERETTGKSSVSSTDLAARLPRKEMSDMEKTRQMATTGSKPKSKTSTNKKPPAEMMPEQKDPATPNEQSMAIRQAEFIEYVGKDICEHLKRNEDFPEWMQNKLSGLNTAAKDLHAALGNHGKDKDMKTEEMTDLSIKTKLSKAPSSGLGKKLGSDKLKADLAAMKARLQKDKKADEKV